MITISTNSKGDVTLSGEGTIPENITIEVFGTVVCEPGSAVKFYNIKFNMGGGNK